MRWIASALFVLVLAVKSHAQQIYLHRLNWSPVPEAILGYKVYRSFNNAQWLMMATTTNNTHTFTNTLAGNYKYRVTAYNIFGESLPSKEVSAGMLTPSTPTNLTLQVIIPINQ